MTNTIYTVSLQYWLADQFWVKGGIGGGTIDLSDTYTGATLGGTSESAIAFSGAAGFEIVQFYSFALDLQFRLAHVAYSRRGREQHRVHGRVQLVLIRRSTSRPDRYKLADGLPGFGRGDLSSSQV